MDLGQRRVRFKPLHEPRFHGLRCHDHAGQAATAARQRRHGTRRAQHCPWLVHAERQRRLCDGLAVAVNNAQSRGWVASLGGDERHGERHGCPGGRRDGEGDVDLGRLLLAVAYGWSGRGHSLARRPLRRDCVLGRRECDGVRRQHWSVGGCSGRRRRCTERDQPEGLGDAQYHGFSSATLRAQHLPPEAHWQPSHQRRHERLHGHLWR